MRPEHSLWRSCRTTRLVHCSSLRALRLRVARIVELVPAASAMRRLLSPHQHFRRQPSLSRPQVPTSCPACTAPCRVDTRRRIRAFAENRACPTDDLGVSVGRLRDALSMRYTSAQRAFREIDREKRGLLSATDVALALDGTITTRAALKLRPSDAEQPSAEARELAARIMEKHGSVDGSGEPRITVGQFAQLLSQRDTPRERPTDARLRGDDVRKRHMQHATDARMLFNEDISVRPRRYTVPGGISCRVGYHAGWDMWPALGPRPLSGMLVPRCIYRASSLNHPLRHTTFNMQHTTWNQAPRRALECDRTLQDGRG